MRRKHKKVIFSRSKIRNKNPGHVFLDFILFFNIAVEKFGKKFNMVKLELSKEIFVINIYNKVDYSIKQTSKLLS